MRGVYVLIIEVGRLMEIEIGQLRGVKFEPGTYAYVGSALGGIEARLRRHLRRKKRAHWHIDHLLGHQDVRVKGAYVLETTEAMECRVAQALAREFPVVSGFGSSDCRCKGHLFRCKESPLLRTLRRIRFNPF